MIDYGIINDFIYPKSEINRIRKTVRVILVNDKKEIGLIHILGKDKFGDRNHYETLGGGVNDNEDLITSLIREVKEEAGYTIKNIKPLGKISIEYFILNRIDEGNFFYAEIKEYVGNSLEDYEKEIFDKVEWFSISEVENLYKKEVENVGKMIHKRDYFMINKAKELGYFD